MAIQINDQTDKDQSISEPQNQMIYRWKRYKAKDTIDMLEKRIESVEGTNKAILTKGPEVRPKKQISEMAEERCRGNGEGPWISSKFLQSSANTMRQRRREFEEGLICTRGEIDLFLCRPSKAVKRSSNPKSLTSQPKHGI